MGKTYVVFIGRKPGVYRCWEEAHIQVNKFSGASHSSFKSRDDAILAFNSYMERPGVVSSTSSGVTSSESTASCSSSSTQMPNRSEKMMKLNDLLLQLEKENRNHASKVAGLTEEIKQQLESLQFSDED